MNRPALLIREVVRLAQERNWTPAVVAERLGVDEETWRHIRAGRSPVSMNLLLAIGRAFGGEPAIQSAIVHYAVIEGQKEHPPKAIRSAATDLPHAQRWRIDRWLATLRTTDPPPRGLFLSGPATLLTRGLRTVVASCAARGVRTHTVRGSDQLAGSHARAALEAELLLVERVDFASDAVRKLLDQRADAMRPFVVTSILDREEIADDYLRRLLRTWTRLIRLRPDTGISHPTRHARRA
jgi:transcriptional regulator with XRE-family HTH domain